MLGRAWENYKKVDPVISFGGNVFSVVVLLGLPVGALMAYSSAQLTWFWETFQWFGFAFIALVTWLLVGLGFNLYRREKTVGDRQLDPWLIGAGVAALILVVCLVGFSLKGSESKAASTVPDQKKSELQSQVASLQTQLATATAAKSAQPHEVSAPSAPILESRLRLHFRPENTLPGAEELLNVWRWYALQHIVNFVSPQNQSHESKSWTLFVTLDKPMNVAQVRVESNVNLPRYEVKDYDGRSAVIAFFGPVTDAVVEIRFLGTSDKVAPRLEPPIPPIPRQLSPYEAELKLRAIDRVLSVLSKDMQQTIDKFSPLQGWWNALKDPKNNPTFRSDLLAFRDEFKAVTLKLDNLRDGMPEYQDLIGMAQQTAYNKAIKAIERYMVQFMYVQDTVKPDASKEALLAFMDDCMTDYHNSMNEFVAWRNTARSNILEMRRKISP